MISAKEIREGNCNQQTVERGLILIDKLVQVNYIDGTGKSFKIVPKRYKSNFNKLTLVSDEYKIYCEPIDRVCCDSEEPEDIGLALEWIEEQIRLRIYDAMKNSIRV